MASRFPNPQRQQTALPGQHDLPIVNRGNGEDETLHLSLENGDFETALQLIPRDGSCITLSPNKFTPLHYACQHGRADMVKILITKYNYSSECRSLNGQTPLHTAAKYGNFNCMDECVSCEPQVRVYAEPGGVECRGIQLEPNLKFFPRDDDGNTPLHIAACHDHLNVVKHLVEKACQHIKCTNANGQTPLHLAAKHGSLNVVQYLLNRGSDLAQADKQGKNALFLAAENGKLDVLMCLAHEKNCNPETLKESIRCNSGQTLLHVACHGGSVRTVEFLTQTLHCSLSTRDESGNTPLHLASEEGHLEVVKYLTIEKHCNPRCRNREGNMPLHLAAYNGCLDVLRFFIRDQNCSAMSAGWNGRTPLHYASQQGQNEVVRFLANDVGVKPSICDKSGVTPLHLASGQGHLEVVRFLTDEMKCDPLCKTNAGDTPLHWAAKNDCSDIVQYFITEKGCDSMCKGAINRTPLHHASKDGKIDVVKYLVEMERVDLLAKDNTLLTVTSELVLPNPFPLHIRKHLPLCFQGNTPLDLACQMDQRDTVFFLASKGATSSSSKLKDWDPLHPNVKICAVGNPGSGKTTLLTAFQNLDQSNVAPNTTGIIPTKFNSSELGEIKLYDFAGENEYYATHETLLGDSSQPLYLVLLNLKDSSQQIRDALHFWEFLISNALNRCNRNEIPPGTLLAHIIAVGSHADCIDQGLLRSKSAELDRIMKSRSHFQSLNRVCSVTLDCRNYCSGGMKRLRQQIQQTCKSVQKQAVFDYQNGHLLKTFIREHLPHQKACTFHELLGWVLDVEDEKFEPLKTPPVLYAACVGLNFGGHIVFLTKRKSPDDSWLLLSEKTILHKVHSLLQHLKNFSQTGVLSLSQLEKVIIRMKDINTELAIRYMLGTDMCTIVNVNITGTEYQNSPPGEKYYFFPSLLSAERPSDVWTCRGNFTHYFGWCLKCTGPYQFFTPKSVEALLIKLIHKFKLVLDPKSFSHPQNCRIWKYGICWWHTDGIETVVEVSQQSKIITVVMRCMLGSEMELNKLRTSVLQQISSVPNDFCPEVKSEELIIHTDCLRQYPLQNAPEVPMTKLARAIVQKDKYVIFEDRKHRFLDLKTSLYFEPYQDLGMELLERLFNPPNSREVVPVETLYDIAAALQNEWKLLAYVLDISPKMIAEIERESPLQTERCNSVLFKWSQSNGTYAALRSILAQYSIFGGRNPLVSHSTCLA